MTLVAPNLVSLHVKQPNHAFLPYTKQIEGASSYNSVELAGYDIMYDVLRTEPRDLLSLL